MLRSFDEEGGWSVLSGAVFDALARGGNTELEPLSPLHGFGFVGNAFQGLAPLATRCRRSAAV